MSAEVLSYAIARLRRASGGDEPPDAALLDAFRREGDEEAFALLVRRHAPMVFGVCVRVLRNRADAEDACQATFLVFVRKVRRVEPDRVGGWLHGVARNVARKARTAALRRAHRERIAGLAPKSDGPDLELRPTLDREVARLPADYRDAVIACDLEGLTRAQAAGRLGWAEGTVASRLARGRAILARRLTRAGFASLVVAVPELNAAFAGRLTNLKPGEAGANALHLAHGVCRTMTLQRLVPVVLGLLAVGGAGLLIRDAQPTAVAHAPPVGVIARAVAEKNIADEPAITVATAAPVVVKTVPAAGTDDVDASLTEIRVTFSKDMMDKTWSWSQISDDTFPPTVGENPVSYDKDKRTCVMKVKLEPGKSYAIWVNSAKFGNFKDTDGRSAVPYLLVFQTKKK
jgi:RNA polymerase sigma factor (sigma-70 family)